MLQYLKLVMSLNLSQETAINVENFEVFLFIFYGLWRDYYTSDIKVQTVHVWKQVSRKVMELIGGTCKRSHFVFISENADAVHQKSCCNVLQLNENR
jgi:hypothetical protein